MRVSDPLLNFLPWREQQRYAQQRRRRIDRLVLLLLWLVPISAVCLMQYHTAAQTRQRTALQARLQRTLKSRQSALNPKPQLASVEGPEAVAADWLQWLKTLPSSIPCGLVLEKILFLAPEEMTLLGESDALQAIETFLSRLEKQIPCRATLTVTAEEVDCLPKPALKFELSISWKTGQPSVAAETRTAL